MIKVTTVFAALALSMGLAMPTLAQDHAAPEIQKQNWSFGGIFGTFDGHQLQRGFQVFREVCSNCHSARLLSFRNLSEPGGPQFTPGQVKELAAQYDIIDPTVEGGKRKGLASDRWPSPFATELEAKDANGGVVPPDMSVLAKARGVEDPFPNWLFNYVTAYSEGGPDYIHALLNGYSETPPADVKVPDGKYYNAVFPGHVIGMPPPLSDGQVTYTADEGGATVPLTVEQYSHDVAAYLMWVADPHQDARKSSGFKVMLFILLFAVLMYLIKRRVWRNAH